MPQLTLADNKRAMSHIFANVITNTKKGSSNEGIKLYMEHHGLDSYVALVSTGEDTIQKEDSYTTSAKNSEGVTVVTHHELNMAKHKLVINLYRYLIWKARESVVP